MPYLKYLADPQYKHMYSVDLAPYVITNKAGHKILIGGMRFGGATAATEGGHWAGDADNDGTIDTDANGNAIQIIPSECTPAEAADGHCLGLSSYFALDITDPMDPQLLWEFNDPLLGYSYSGPAYITIGSQEYVMFGSGPTNYLGQSAQENVNLFVLKVDSDFHLTSNPLKKIHMSGIDNGFVGRLFTTGIDNNKDGSTDLVSFGVSWYENNSWKGNAYLLAPSTWELTSVLPTSAQPVTAKVAFDNCYGDPFIYFGSGRWFFKDDDPGGNADNDTLYGVKVEGCLDNLGDGNSSTNCSQGLGSVNTGHHGDAVCSDVENTNTAWSLHLDGRNNASQYYKERDISDPTTGAPNLIFMTTMEPSSDVCSFGGRSRIWGVNCMSGHNMFAQGCPQPDGTYYGSQPPEASLLLQLSGGNLENLHLDDTTFSENDDYTTDWMTGTPPEGGAKLHLTSMPMPADIILWLER